jgi:hypothetical protein
MTAGVRVRGQKRVDKHRSSASWLRRHSATLKRVSSSAALTWLRALLEVARTGWRHLADLRTEISAPGLKLNDPRTAPRL